MILSAKEFRKVWKQQNPKVVHIPSDYELGLMEQYAKYYHEQQVKNCSIPNVVGSSCPECGSTNTRQKTKSNDECKECKSEWAV